MTTPTSGSVIVDTANSPNVILQAVPTTHVTIEDLFWRSRREVNRQVMLPAQYRLCEETGRIDNLRRAAGKLDGEFTGWFFNDSDVYKWIEAAAWQLSAGPDPELESLIDRLSDEIADAQQPDGYLNSYFMGERTSRRWTDFDRHEMYCAGHLFQAAIAYFRMTGKSKLLNVSCRFADHICARFGPEDQGKHFGTDGHPEIEMALVELYRTTGDKKYLDQAAYFIDIRGSGRLGQPFGRFDSAYHQDHLPFRQLTRLEGHSVRAVYLNCGATDLYAETGDFTLLTALDRMWTSMSQRQIYLNGGLGSRYEIEWFGPDYELPNDRAHTETCASVANVMWNWRMLLLKGEAQYADMMELSLYNSVLSGVSLDGSAYFYQNPLSTEGSHRRQHWFAVACCPSNAARILAQLPGYFYCTSTEGIYVNLYATGSATIDLPDKKTVSLTQRTDYPWTGEIEIKTATVGSYALFLRIPGWCESTYSLTVNGQPANAELLPNGYLKVSRKWQNGDAIQLVLPMEIRKIESHPYVTDNQGRVALMRGPLLYCVEGADNSAFDVRLLTLTDADELTAAFVPDLLNGVNVLRGSAHLLSKDESWHKLLYRRTRPNTDQKGSSIAFTAIPYFAWANREPHPMQVWLLGH